jgi:hypothetical protein
MRNTTIPRVKAAIIGSGNIGTDLMIKVMHQARHVEMGAMVGVDPHSDGLARAKRLNVATTAEGIDGLIKLDVFPEIDVVFDATSAGAHRYHNEVLQRHGIQVIDLTPAAIGPYVIPAINLEAENAANMNMVMRRAGHDPDCLSRISCREGSLRGDRGFHLEQVGRTGHAGQYRRVHRNHARGNRKTRRRRAGQGCHRAEPGRATAHHA